MEWTFCQATYRGMVDLGQRVMLLGRGMRWNGWIDEFRIGEFRTGDIYIYDYIHNVNFCGNLLWDNTRPQVSVISSLALHFIDAPNEIQDSSLCFGR